MLLVLLGRVVGTVLLLGCRGALVLGCCGFCSCCSSSSWSCTNRGALLCCSGALVLGGVALGCAGVALLPSCGGVACSSWGWGCEVLGRCVEVLLGCCGDSDAGILLLLGMGVLLGCVVSVVLLLVLACSGWAASWSSTCCFNSRSVSRCCLRNCRFCFRWGRVLLGCSAS